MLTATLWSPSETGSSGRLCGSRRHASSAPHLSVLRYRACVAPTSSALQVRRISVSATEESEMALPRGLAPRASAFARLRADSYTLEAKTGAACRYCPGALCLEDRHAATASMPRKWWLAPVSRRTLLDFSEALICLSYPANGPSAQGVPAYWAGALLLSYGGMKGSPDSRAPKAARDRLRAAQPEGRVSREANAST